MRASRLVSILILLQLRGRMTAAALAEEFEVSERTIYRDIDDLSAAGIPLYGDRGPGGGFQLLDGYRTRLTGLDGAEAEAMMMAGLPGPAQALGIGAAAAGAANKMLASLPSGLGVRAARLGERFHLDPVDWYRAGEVTPHLPHLARAVLDQLCVAMRYESWRETREWEVEPLGLVLKAGAWYLTARGAGKVRMFRVSNIHMATVLEKRFARPAAFDLASWWADSLRRFEANLRPANATLRATPEGLKRIAGLGAFAASAVKAAQGPDASGCQTLQLPFETIGQAALMVLGLGPEVDVIEPMELRLAVERLATAVVKRMEDAEPRTQ